MRISLLSIIFLFMVSPSMGKMAVTRKSEAGVVKPASKDPVENILNSQKLNDYLKDPKRYRPPYELMVAINSLSDFEKESKLQEWFIGQDKAFLRSLALWGILWRILFLSTLASVATYFIGQFMWSTLKRVYTTIRDLVYPPPVANPVGRTVLGTLAASITRAIEGMGFGGIITNLLNNMGVPFNANLPDRVAGAVDNMTRNFLGGRALGILSAISSFGGLAILRILWVPIRYFIDMGWDVYILAKFYYNPSFDNPLERSEILYIRSLYLFSPSQSNVIEELLSSTRAGDISKVNEVEQFIKTYRALPYGVKPVAYNQELIDEYFSTYPPEIKSLAERLIALLVLRTEAIETGKEYLFYDLAIKAILLYGPPGTGKSNFFKLICKVLGLNHISLIIMDPETDLKGKSGEKLGTGIPSALVKGYLAAVDEYGRTYENYPVIIEEIDKPLNESNPYKGAVSAYYHIVLDPKTEFVKDDYLHSYVSKPFFVWATTNYKENLPEAILDRFTIFHLSDIAKELKKKIAREILIPIWVELLTNNELSEVYGHYLSPQDCEYILIQRAEKYIDESDEPGMRGAEDEIKKGALELLVADYKETNNMVQYMKEVEAWKEEQATLGNKVSWEEDPLENLAPEQREWRDICWETGEWNDPLALAQWYPPSYDKSALQIETESNPQTEQSLKSDNPSDSEEEALPEEYEEEPNDQDEQLESQEEEMYNEEYEEELPQEKYEEESSPEEYEEELVNEDEDQYAPNEEEGEWEEYDEE